MNVGLKCLVQSEGSWTDGAAEWMVRGRGIVIRHRLRPEMMDNSGAELVGVRKVEIEPSVSMQAFGTQGTLVETLDGVEEDVELEVTVMQDGKGTVGATKLEQERRHALVGSGEKTLFDD